MNHRLHTPAGGATRRRGGDRERMPRGCIRIELAEHGGQGIASRRSQADRSAAESLSGRSPRDAGWVPVVVRQRPPMDAAEMEDELTHGPARTVLDRRSEVTGGDEVRAAPDLGAQ
ncbi:MAG: hypothetical protein R2705_02585 [Ilumatobacteraceae bacterium]